MSEEHRLSSLQMCVAGHDHVRPASACARRTSMSPVRRSLVAAHRSPQIELQIEGDLVVAAAPGVNLAAHRTG